MIVCTKYLVCILFYYILDECRTFFGGRAELHVMQMSWSGISYILLRH